MRIAASLLVLACAACGSDVQPGEQDLLDEQAVAMVEQANAVEPPLEAVVPEPILYPDIETHDIYGASCSYAPGTSLGARAIARQADAYIKLDGEIIRFAADPGARELAFGTRSLYNGREYSLRLQIDGEGEGDAIGEGTINLRDRWDRVIYTGTGSVQCSA